MNVDHPRWRKFVDIAQVIGAIAGVLAIGVSIYLYFRTKAVFEVSYSFSPTSTIASVEPAGDEVTGRVQILYDGQEVPNVYLAQVLIQNTGNIPLRREAIRNPIAFGFGKDTRLLTWRIASKEPNNIECSLIRADDTDNEVYLDLDLLNPDEKIYVQFVYAGEGALPEVSARVEGLRELRRASWNTQTELYDSPVLTVVIVAIAYAVIIAGLTNRRLRPYFRWVFDSTPVAILELVIERVASILRSDGKENDA